MSFLKQSTTATVQVGPFVDATDGVTPETGLTPGIEVSKAGAAFGARNSATAVSHDAEGFYRVELDGTDTGTLGTLIVKAIDSANHVPVWQTYTVLPANVYDSMIGGTDALQVHASEISNDLITAAAIATDAIDADAIKADAVTEIQNGLATSAALATVDTNVDAILVDTNELQTDLVDGGRLDLLIDAILEDTGTTLPASISGLNNLSAAQVNAEVVDALNTDTYAEPTGTPGATVTLAAKINWLYKYWRNKKAQTADTATLYNDDGTTADITSTVADDGTTATKGEWSA